MSVPTVLRGIIRGKVIELEQMSGLPDGEAVEITVQPASAKENSPDGGEGIRRSAGGWAEDAEELDRYLEWNRQQRKQSRREVNW